MTARSNRSRTRRILAVAMALAGAALLLVPPVRAQDGQVRTQTDLLGYDIEVEAAPLSFEIYERFIPIPTDPGVPQFELTPSYSRATLGTGPQSRAVASSLWPGAGLGDGFGTVVGDESQTFPLRAAARYPGGGKKDWTASQSVDEANLGMTARAEGLDVVARSESGGAPEEMADALSFGQVRSRSVSTVKEGQAIGRSVSAASNVSLLGGTIVLDNVRTEMEAMSDGETAASTGRTVVEGITIAGMPVKLTGDGLVLEERPDDGDGDGDDEGDGGDGGQNPLGPVTDVVDPVNQAIQRLTSDLVADGIEETLGISIRAAEQTEEKEGAITERRASGLVISIDLRVLRDYLQPIVDQVPVGELFKQVPDDGDGNVKQLKGLVFELLGLGPRLDVTVGRGLVATSASPAFEPPPLPDLPAPPPVDTNLDSGSISAPSGGVSLGSTGSSGSVGVPGADVAPPASTGGGAETPVLAAEPLDPFGGVPIAFAGIALLLAAIPTWGLRTLREAAVGSDASTETPQRLVDLRGGF